jgi:hypothetical protein
MRAGRCLAIWMNVAIVLSATLSPCWADGYAKPGEFVSLFHEPSKRDELSQALKISPDQWEKIDALVAQFRREAQRLQAAGKLGFDTQRALIDNYNARIASLLQSNQLDALKRISLKEQGISALLEPAIAEKLRLTAKQTALLKEIESEAERKHRYKLDHLPRMTAAGLAEVHSQDETNKAKAMLAVLDSQQREEWQELNSQR